MINKEIISEMVCIRKSMGYSREKLATIIGVKTTAIKQLESRYTGNLTIFLTILAFYRNRGVDVNSLIDKCKAQGVVLDSQIF